MGAADDFVLAASNKVYSSLQQRYIRLPKQFEQDFDHFHLVKSGTANLSVCYLLAYRLDSQDRLKMRRIRNFLTNPRLFGEDFHDSLLIESQGESLG